MSFDPKIYKSDQRREWGEAAPGWMKWWDRIEDSAGAVSERLVELAAVTVGSRVLDVATGIGEPALTAAKKAGPGGMVVGTDISPLMLEFAGKRAEAEALTNVKFVECDMEELATTELAGTVLAGTCPEGEQRFDAALCRWGLIFCPDPAAALAGIYSVLKDGGTFAGAVWSTPERVPMASVSFDVISRELALKPPPPSDSFTPGIFSLADTSLLKGLMEGAGFKDVSTEPHPVTYKYDSPRQYVDMIKDLAAPIRAMVANETEERQSEVWQKVAEACGPYTKDDGVVEMVSETIIVWGRK